MFRKERVQIYKDSTSRLLENEVLGRYAAEAAALQVAGLFMCHIMLKPYSRWLWSLWLEMAKILCSRLIYAWVEKP